MGTTAGDAGLVFEVLIGADDALEVLVGEEALGAFAGDFVHRVDEEDFPRRALGFCVRQTTTQASLGEWSKSFGRMEERIRCR